MGKNQSASGLTNIIQYDNNGNVSFVSGSTTLMQISSSGAITTTGVISGSNALSSSYALNSGLLNSTGSVGFATTASLLTVSSSQQQISASQQQLSSSFLILTASFNAVSASYTALSGSYNTFSGSASTRITVDSASLLQVSASQQQISASLLNVISIFATTGSNSFRATQSITGSLTVTGQIIAQTLNVQQVTSSIIYSSGSNNFGCDLNSRQTFTGSVLITGSLTIAGASSATSYSGATIYGSTAVCSAVGKFSTCLDLGGALTGTSATFSSCVTATSFNLGNGQYLRLTRNSGALQYDAFGIVAGTDNTRLLITNDFDIVNGSLVSQFKIAGSGAATFSSTVDATKGTFTSAPSLGGEQIRAYSNSGANTSYGGLLVINSTGKGGYLTSGDNSTTTWYGAQAGYVTLGGTAGAAMKFRVDADDTKGITIATTGAATFSGNVNINGASAANPLTVKVDTNLQLRVDTYLSSTNLASINAAASAYMPMKIDGTTLQLNSQSGGCVGIGTTCPVNKFQIGTMAYPYSGNDFGISNGTIDFAIDITSTSSDIYSSAAMSFATNTAERMRITCAGITCFGFTVCAPCFATISDYRMKSNIRPIAGLSIIMNTKPYKFEYNYDCSTSFGMIAHELQDALPEAVFGQKDGEVMQGVDYMKLLPIAIKAIQEQQCKIALLESCLGIV